MGSLKALESGELLRSSRRTASGRAFSGLIRRILPGLALLAAGCGTGEIDVFDNTDQTTTSDPSGPTGGTGSTDTTTSTDQDETGLSNLVPLPVSITPAGSTFTLDATSGAAIYVDTGAVGEAAVATYLRSKLAPSTGYPLAVTPVDSPPASGIYLTTSASDPNLGDEGYLLTVTPTLVTLSAPTRAGLFRGVQTLRQMLPPAIERSTLQPGPWAIPTGTIRDYPRYPWRGAMLDVARHFFTVDAVERYMDEMAYFKLNVLHLHLSDDQGWRVQIKGWENLTGDAPTTGSYSEVGNATCAGCFYTQAQYAALVAYARDRYITLVPEFDGPGHVNAVLHAYGSLTCKGKALPAYTGTSSPGTSFCTSKPSTYLPFLTDVITQISALTEGTYFHMGGDEAVSIPLAEFVAYEQQVKLIVESSANAHGEHMHLIGWEEIAQGAVSTTSAAQHWKTTEGFAAAAVQQGARVLMSPADHCYLDQKYDKKSPGGALWAGFVDTQAAYSWDPASIVPGVTGSSVLGVEAPLFTEHVPDQKTLDEMTYPRLAGHAEIGWSAASGSAAWPDYARRIGSFGSRFQAQGIQYYADPNVGIDWH
jgi:hexosaminidase